VRRQQSRQGGPRAARQAITDLSFTFRTSSPRMAIRRSDFWREMRPFLHLPSKTRLCAFWLPAYDAFPSSAWRASPWPHDRDVHVHLLPDWAPAGRLIGGLAGVIDVLRSTTTMIRALAAGCTAVRPCVEVEEARALANKMRAGRVLLGGERGGLPLPGFDLGNSPGEYTAKACCGTTLVLTTT